MHDITYVNYVISITPNYSIYVIFVMETMVFATNQPIKFINIERLHDEWHQCAYCLPTGPVRWTLMAELNVSQLGHLP